MRIVDLHCYPNTKEWIACQQPYVDALAEYWGRGWVAKDEADVVNDDLSVDHFVGNDQVDDHFGYIVGIDHALERRGLRTARHQIVVAVAERPLHPIALHPARRHRIHANIGAEVDGKQLREADDGGFARGIRQRLQPGTQADDACRVDDAAARRFEHRNRGARHLKKSAHVDRKYTIPFLGGHLVELLRSDLARDAGVIGEGIEPAERRLDGGEHLLHGRVVADVRFIKQ